MFNKCLILAGLTVLVAQPSLGQTLAAHQEIEKRVLTIDETGEERVEFVRAVTISPGDTLRYTLHYNNQGDEPAEAVTLTMPVPEQTDFLEVSVPLNSIDVSYSYNGGDTYVSSPHAEEGMDPTHIRWMFTESVAAGAKGRVSFTAILN